jgi:hypothetical protein
MKYGTWFVFSRSGHGVRCRAWLAAAAALLLAACIPYPHTSEKFPAIHGRILDAATLQPLAGAKIAIHDHPSTTATSDAAGRYSFHARKNYHLGVVGGACASDWPEGEEWDVVLDVTREGYEPQPWDGSTGDAVDPTLGREIPDILLVPCR